MIRVIVSAFDRAAGAFGQPVFAPNAQVAVRSFTAEVNRKSDDNQVYLAPDDFDLYVLGSFDDSNGKVVPEETPRIIVRGKDVAVRGA